MKWESQAIVLKLSSRAGILIFVRSAKGRVCGLGGGAVEMAADRPLLKDRGGGGPRASHLAEHWKKGTASNGQNGGLGHGCLVLTTPPHRVLKRPFPSMSFFQNERFQPARTQKAVHPFPSPLALAVVAVGNCLLSPVSPSSRRRRTEGGTPLVTGVAFVGCP